MTTAPIFHGNSLARAELLAALTRNCECVMDTETGATTTRCPGHTSLVTSQSFVDHLEFGRWLHLRLEQEEFICPEAPP